MNTPLSNHPPQETHRPLPDPVPTLPLVKLIAEILARVECSHRDTDKVA